MLNTPSYEEIMKFFRIFLTFLHVLFATMTSDEKSVTFRRGHVTV